MFLAALLLVAASFDGDSTVTGLVEAASGSPLLLEAFVELRRCFLGVGPVDAEASFVAAVVAPFFFGGMVKLIPKLSSVVFYYR